MSIAGALLLDESPLVVQRSLVRALGGHSLAAFVQQVHYRSRIGPKQGGHRWAVATIAEWCEDVVLTQEQLKTVIAKLTAMGVIIREAKQGSYDRTRWTRIDYEVLEALVAKNPSASKAPDGDVDHDADVSSKKSKTKTPPTPPPGGADESAEKPTKARQSFEVFWPIYSQMPRVGSKGAALRAWEARGVTNAMRDEMIRVAAVCVKQVEAEPNRWAVPHASTWINQRRYLDESLQERPVPPPEPTGNYVEQPDWDD